jgi:membrane-associated phospholipid phosphatase
MQNIRKAVQNDTLTTKFFVGCCMLSWLILVILLAQFSSFEIFKTINAWHTPALDKIVPLLTLIGEFWIVVPILLGMLLNARFRNSRMFIALVICNLLPFGITHLLKQIYKAPRPMHYFEHATWHHFVDGQPKQYQFSFPSGHTEGAFALMTFLVMMIPAKHWYWGVILFLIAVMVAFSRIYLSQHFLEDVLAGSMIGVVFCYLPFKIIRPVRDIN